MKMKKSMVIMCAVLLVFGFMGISNATLWDRGGGLIYDDVLNVTWLQDVNYAKTSGYDSDGKMSWSDALAWAESLEYYDPVRDVYWTDWRLTEVLPVNGSSYGYNFSEDGSTDFGYNISAPGSAYPGSTGSEMAYMWYNNLGNISYHDVDGNSPQPGWNAIPNSTFIDGYGDSVSFQNLESVGDYWSGTEYAPGPFDAWSFNITHGDQLYSYDHYETYAWAVRDGDVVPLNATPIADAGDDQIVFDEVILYGSDSYDPDPEGSIISYDWTLSHRTNSDNDRDASGVNPIIDNLSPGFYDACLTVTDDGGATDMDCFLIAAAGPCSCTASKMHIESIQADVFKGKYGKATVTIIDDCGNPVAAAQVTGTFSDDFDETRSGVTDANGMAVILTEAEVKKPLYTFCVNNVAKGTLTYEPNENVETCERR